ncbi:MAG: pentapeptide repeat-containing protein [Cyclobacteriaceae bacterium]|nr:pentapeptide repeat-containing protein [Cyclobacteriaceae bacterium]
MRTIFTLILISAFSAAYSQNTVKASDIIRQINDGQSVLYKNAEIEGELDLTDLHTRRHTDSSFDFFGKGNDQYESTVEVSLTFINCTFRDDVLAYYHIERDNDTYIAHFEEDVIFQNCTFRRASEFKYSEFEEKTDFSGTTFNREANFKYAEFNNTPVFANAKFTDDANFKYAEFPRGANFESSSFDQLANFKYTKFRTPLNIKNIAFRGEEDFKYTRVDGNSFTSYLLNNR